MKHLSDGGESTKKNVDCGIDPTASLITMFVDMIQAGRIAKGQCPALRPVFHKTHGIAAAEFRILPELPDRAKTGLFATPGHTYPAWVRFSSDTSPNLPDYKSTLGIGIKLFDVPGKKLLGNPDAGTFDFLLQNSDVFFVDTAADMCAFTKAGVVDGDYGPYLKQHPKTAALLDAMEKPAASVLSSPYWSALPFQFGASDHVKYKLDPVLEIEPPTAPPSDPTYLSSDLSSRLRQGENRFRFLLQFRGDPEEMPLDQATVRWSEELSEPIHVADLVIPSQDITVRGQSEYGENLAFNTWRVTAEHRPAGSIADARRAVYAASADLRRNVNGVPLGEPDKPRPLIAPGASNDQVVVRASIHPAIGIARVGDSAEEYYIGPEVTAVPAANSVPAGFYRDKTGAIKRQAARFRIYGFNAQGEVVRELTPDNAHIVWTVHVANRKAQWYQFQYALDIPEAVNASDNAFPLRNSGVRNRSGLAIDPGPRSISGRNVEGGPEHAFDTGTFQAKSETPVGVHLGEIRTDEAGRLIFLGGTGKSGSPTQAPVFDPAHPATFNNADDWYDDTSDGPVTASVAINGTDIPVEGAWVVVGPPNYAPHVISWRTMYDLMCNTYVEAGWMTMPETPSFSRDIYPILHRLCGLQWVNKGFAAFFGKGGPMDFSNPEFLSQLASRPSRPGGPDPYAELRRAVFHQFRPARPIVAEPVAWPHIWPWIYGDAFGSFPETGPGNMLSMTELQEGLLRHWVEGNFISDWNASESAVTQLQALPLAQQPQMLDQAALHYCLADTFHPGCELTWPMRHASMYSRPFRIRRRPDDKPEPDYGEKLTPAKISTVDGPLYAQPPGGLTRWMAIPWQGDTAFCRSGYDPEFDPYLPTFWAARVPNQVLTEANYRKAVDISLSREDRLAAYHDRSNWLRGLHGTDIPGIMMDMVAHFGQLGIIEARAGIANDPDFPDIMYVETRPAGMLKATADAALNLTADLQRPLTQLEKAGWESHEQLQAFRAVRLQKR